VGYFNDPSGFVKTGGAKLRIRDCCASRMTGGSIVGITLGPSLMLRVGIAALPTRALGIGLALLTTPLGITPPFTLPTAPPSYIWYLIHGSLAAASFTDGYLTTTSAQILA
jgi:hypothetical protein